MTDREPTTCMRCAVGCGYQQRAGDDGEFLDVRGDDDHPERGQDLQSGVRETIDPSGGEGDRTADPPGRDAPADRLGHRSRDRFGADYRGAQERERQRRGAGKRPADERGGGVRAGKLARGFGTRYYDANTTLCMASAVQAYVQAFGSDAPPPTYDDIPDAETHVIWGARRSPIPCCIAGSPTARAGTTGELIVVDPVESETAADADLHVSPEPGTDLALARAVLAQVVDDGLVDREFIEHHTEGFEAMVGSLPDVDVAAETAGVPVERVSELAAAFDARTLVYWGMGVNQSVQGTGTARSLIDLCLATGNLGPGSGLLVDRTGELDGEPRLRLEVVVAGIQTVRRHGSPQGYRQRVGRSAEPASRLVRAGVRPDHRRAGAGQRRRLLDGGDEPGRGDARREPRRERPRRHVPDRPRRVPLRHRRAGGRGVAGGDVGESEGTVMNMERRVSRVSAAREPPADVRRQDVDIIGAVARPCRFGSVRFDAARPRSAVRRGQRPDARHDGRPLGDLLRAAVRGAGRPVARPDETGEGGYRYYDGDGADAEDARDATPDDARTADGRSRPTRAERGSRTRLTGACRSRSTRRTPHAHHRPSSGRVQHRGPDSA